MTRWFVLGGYHAVGEQLDDGLAVVPVFVVEQGVHARCQVGLAFFDVFQHLSAFLETNAVRYVQLFQQQPDQLYVVTCSPVIIQERVGVQVYGILVNERMGLVIDPDRIFLCM